jgi:integrase
MWVRKAPSGRWRGSYRDPSGRVRSRSFDRRRDAESWAREAQRTVERGAHIDPDLGKMMFSDWATRWYDSAQDLRPSSRARVEIAIRRELLPRFASHRLSAIGHEDVQELVNDLVSRGAAPASTRKVFHVLSAIMGTAVSSGRILSSPCANVRLPQVRRREMRCLSAEELHRLAEEVPERDRALILVAGYLGLRWSEIVGLRVGDVSLLERRLTVRNTVVELNGHLHEGPPKTSGSERTMTIPAFIADLIGMHIGKHPSKVGYVFTSPEGGPLRKNFMGRVFGPCTRRAGLEGLRFHDLRHTAAALAISIGAHPKVIQQRLGHSSIKTTLDTYGHLLPNLDVALAEGLDGLAREAAAAYVLPAASLAAVPDGHSRG